MAWSDEARKASANARSAKAPKVVNLDEHARALGFKSHDEFLKLTAPRKGADKNKYRPKSMGKW